MTYTVCNAVTHAVTRCVQNQNQNQTVVKGFCSSSWANESIHRFGSRGLGLEKRMAADAAKIRGAR